MKITRKQLDEMIIKSVDKLLSEDYFDNQQNTEDYNDDGYVPPDSKELDSYYKARDIFITKIMKIAKAQGNRAYETIDDLLADFEGEWGQFMMNMD